MIDAIKEAIEAMDKSKPYMSAYSPDRKMIDKAIAALQALQSGEPVGEITSVNPCDFTGTFKWYPKQNGNASIDFGDKIYSRSRPTYDKETLCSIFNEYHTLPYNPKSEHYRPEHFYKALLKAGAVAAPQPVVDRNDLIELLIATRTQSEGVTADLIIKLLSAGKETV
jgi:hypothetical protein